MRRTGSALTVLGLVLALSAAVVHLVLPDLAIRYPNVPLDVTAHSAGSFFGLRTGTNPAPR